MEQVKRTKRRILSILLTLVMVVSTFTGIVPGTSLKVKAVRVPTTFSGEVEGDLMVGDILEPGASWEGNPGSTTIVLQAGGYCILQPDISGMTYSKGEVEWTPTISFAQPENPEEIEEINLFFINVSDYEDDLGAIAHQFYPYAKGKKVDAWQVVSVEEIEGVQTITLTGYAETQEPQEPTGYESFTTNQRKTIYNGNFVTINCSDSGDDAGFYISTAAYATISVPDGKIITKVEFTRGFYDINNLQANKGTITIEDDVATVSGVNAGSLTVTGKAALLIKEVKVYYEDPVPVTGVTLSPNTTQTIEVGKKASFTASVQPENATDKMVKWSVGGTNVGAVKLYSDEDCTNEVGIGATETLTVYAKGISVGSATVKATSNWDDTQYASCDVTVNPATYSVTITPGNNMTKTEASGAASQTGLSDAMTPVVYTADNGYYFPEGYSVETVSGISVKRDSFTQITVLGTPTADAEITLPDATAKTKADAPTTAAAVNCTTTANNDGKLTGVTTAMEYKKSDATSWTDGTGSDITGLVPGTYYVRVKATDTKLASDNQVLTIAPVYDVSVKAGTGMTKTEASGDAEQKGLSGAMTAVVYTADEGYYFPEGYSVATVSGISVTRDSYTKITVSGTPTASATITLTAATAKTTPVAPTTAAAVNCTTADNNDGKLTGVTTAMEYQKSGAESWTAGTGSDITGLVPGTYYVRVKATDTTLASANQELTIAEYVPPTYDVSVKAGTGMTKTEASGAVEQTGLSGAMTAVVYTADNGYYFPEGYSVATVSGISVKRDSFTQITVSGTPTASATITLTAATAKTTPAAPTAAAAVNCTSADDNDGKLTGVTTAMEYQKSGAESWTAGTGSDITGLVPGKYYVRLKATDTTFASANQELTIKDSLTVAKAKAKADLDELLTGKNQSDYDEEDWTALNTAINNAKSAIDNATTLDAVATVKSSAVDTVDEVKTIEEKAAEVIATAKAKAKADLDELLAGKNQSDYDEADWTALVTAINNAKNAIDNATTAEAVAAAKTDASGAVEAVKTKEEKVAEAVDTAKTDAKADLDTILSEKNETDYDEADWTAINAAITECENAINNATTTDAIEAAKTKAVNAIAAIKTKAQKALDNTKTAAAETINGVNVNDYITDDRDSVTNAKTAALATIEAATTQAEVEAAINTFKTAITGCTTQKEADDTAASSTVTGNIGELPAIDNIKITDEDAITQAREAYEALTDDQKALVPEETLAKLVAAEEELAKVKDMAAFDNYKAAEKKAIEDLTKEDDSDASKQLIADAAAALEKMAYDVTDSLEDNKAEVAAIIKKLEKELAKQRAIDAEKAETEAAIKVDQGDTVAEVDTQKIDAKDVAIVDDVAKNTTADLENAAIKQVQEIVKESENVEGNDKNIVIVPSLQVKAEEYDVSEDNATMTLDIDAVYTSYETTNDITSAADVKANKDDENKVKQIGSGKLNTEGTLVDVKLVVPDAFAQALGATTTKTKDSAVTVYVKHTHKERNYEYNASLYYGTGKYYVEFTNPNGFSPFTISGNSESVATVGGKNYTDIQSAIDDAEDGSTIKLTNDSDVTATINAEKTIIIDKDNHTGNVDIQTADTLMLIKTENADGTTTYKVVKKYTVTFDANGGMGTMPVQEIGETAALNDNTFIKAGFIFAGWNTNADGTGTAYADKAEVAPTADMTLYAQWNEDPNNVVEVIKTKINELKTVDAITLDDKAAIVEARAAFETLTPEQKALVGEEILKKLTDAELIIAEIEKAAALEEAKKESFSSLSNPVKVTQKGKKIQIKWSKSSLADGYDVYVQYCGKKASKPVKSIDNNTTTKATVTKIGGKKLNLSKNFYVYVNAYKVIDGEKVVLAKSMVGYVAGSKNAKYSNVKKLTLTKSKYTVKVGKTAKIKAKVTLANKSKKHLPKSQGAKIRYRSMDKTIATVDKNGKIKGVSAGKCTIYVYSINGLAKKVSVTVN